MRDASVAKLAPVLERALHRDRVDVLEVSADRHSVADARDLDVVGGFWIGIDQYGVPDPTETVLIPTDALRPIQGEYRLSVMEPMEEVCYIDRLALRVVEHPENVEVYPDELFGTGELKPTGMTLAVEKSQRVFPIAAVGTHGEDVLPQIQELDRCYADCGTLDPDLVGYTEPHSLSYPRQTSLPSFSVSFTFSE